MVTPPRSAALERAQRAATGGTPVPAVDRERVVQALGVHFAYDRLSLDAYEERLELAYRAVNPEQLQAVLAGLPATSQAEAESLSLPLLLPAAEVPERAVLMAMMGGQDRKGSWIVPRHLKVWAAAGGAKVDLREARFAPGVTEVEIMVFLGGVELIVPPGVRVDTSSVACFAGGVDNDAGDATALSSLHPTIRLSGFAMFGGIDVKTRLPGESDKEYKQRRKREKKRGR